MTKAFILLESDHYSPLLDSLKTEDVEDFLEKLANKKNKHQDLKVDIRKNDYLELISSFGLSDIDSLENTVEMLEKEKKELKDQISQMENEHNATICKLTKKLLEKDLL